MTANIFKLKKFTDHKLQIQKHSNVANSIVIIMPLHFTLLNGKHCGLAVAMDAK